MDGALYLLSSDCLEVDTTLFIEQVSWNYRTRSYTRSGDVKSVQYRDIGGLRAKLTLLWLPETICEEHSETPVLWLNILQVQMLGFEPPAAHPRLAHL
ncbi:hypothetical protein HNQ77_001244 [Silvibacterium bohemicum]|uniref:Uncharacterized protein n=1 Tax=Silvibacterium bohemicum TaxID=1577686 RepID=A0A841JQ74_9BACT|nr:hypothetical protein [Silvibacterium bohemicum]